MLRTCSQLMGVRRTQESSSWRSYCSVIYTHMQSIPGLDFAGFSGHRLRSRCLMVIN